MIDRVASSFLNSPSSGKWQCQTHKRDKWPEVEKFCFQNMWFDLDVRLNDNCVQSYAFKKSLSDVVDIFVAALASMLIEYKTSLQRYVCDSQYIPPAYSFVVMFFSLESYFESYDRILNSYHSCVCFNISLEDEMGWRRRAGIAVVLHGTCSSRTICVPSHKTTYDCRAV